MPSTGPLFPHTVAVLHRSREHIRNRLDAAVRVPGKPRQIILRHIIPKIIQQQERVEIRSIAKAERTAQVHSRPFRRRLGLDQPLHRSYGHGRLLVFPRVYRLDAPRANVSTQKKWALLQTKAWAESIADRNCNAV